MSHFLLFGNHPRLSLAEYKAVCGADVPAPRLVAHAAVVDDAGWDGAQLMLLLGGTVKLGDVLATLPVEEVDAEKLAELCLSVPRGMGDKEIAFGCSVVGGTPGVKRKLERLPLGLKRAFKANGIRSRWVTSKDSPTLAPAAVAKLKMTTEGYDVVLLADGQMIHVGVTTHVQNADAWSQRDYGRPVRDDANGMLPPKLARMMVNLGKVEAGQTLLDPFCGSGTVLMEAALGTQAAKLIGSDLEDKKVSDSMKNTEWLVKAGVLTREDAERMTYFQSDVKKLAEQAQAKDIDRVVTEGSLGPPLRGHESQKQLDANRDLITALWKDALRVMHPLLNKDAHLVVCWPSYKTTHGLSRVKLDDDLESLGYALVNPLAGWDDTGAPMIYHREGQKVARRIVVLTKKDG